MRKWVVLGVVVLLVFSSFGFVFAEQFQEVKDLQVKTEKCEGCSCQDFDVDKALSEVNAKIENLTKVINQEEAELQKLYAELNRTKSIETLEKIVKLEDKVQNIKHDLKAFERQKLSLELVKKYTRKTPYGLQVLYYKLPREDVLVKQYIEKVHPVREDVDLDWFIAFYRQAGELTFDEYIETDMKLRETLKAVKAGNATIEDALKLIQQRKEIWDRIYGYLEEKTKLETIKRLKELGKQQTIMKTIGIQPLGIDNIIYYSELGTRYVCSQVSIGGVLYCGGDNPLKDTLPPYYISPVEYRDLEPIAVWVGVYASDTPNSDYYLGQFCVYTFKKESELHYYWERARNYDVRAKSIQIKYFYDGIAYNPKTSEEQVANLIWQFECNANGCWLTSYRPHLPNPDNPYYIPNDNYRLYVYWRVLSSNCCKSGSSHDNPYGCLWANGHCGGCFAPDDSASQYFPHVDRPYQVDIPQS